MARLVVNPGSPTAWEIQLKPGDNFIGRGFANDFKLTDPSVSSSHCQITVSDASILLKDLGSTNGTYVNRAPVREAVLQTGQSIHMGGVEMMFYSDGAAPVRTAPPAPSVRMVGAPVRATAAPVAVPRAAPVAAPPPAIPMPPPVSAPPPPAAAVGRGKCKYHPKTAGRFYCGQCQVHYCELCVTTRNVGGAPHKFCRHCGAEVTPVQVQIARPVTKGFFARLPGVFIYPFQGSGLLVLIISTLVFAGLEFVGSGFSILAKIVALGYLFAYMQNIIHATANQEEQMPDLPGMDDLFGCCFRLLGAVFISFGIAIGLALYAFFQEEPAAGIALIPAIIFGCFYFPMALLAVAMKDSVAAANPLVVIPAIFKVPIEYFVTVILMAGVFGVRMLGGTVVAILAGNTYTTKDMNVLLTTLGVRAVWSFVIVYLLTINMRLLGILYLTKKDKLGWFSH
jgi:hypothetical protein